MHHIYSQSRPYATQSRAKEPKAAPLADAPMRPQPDNSHAILERIMKTDKNSYNHTMSNTLLTNQQTEPLMSKRLHTRAPTILARNVNQTTTTTTNTPHKPSINTVMNTE